MNSSIQRLAGLLMMTLLASPVIGAMIGSSVRDGAKIWKALVIPGIATAAWFCLGMLELSTTYHGDQGGFILLVPIVGGISCGLSLGAAHVAHSMASRRRGRGEYSNRNPPDS